MIAELRTGHVVKTGEGALCRVQYVHADGDVELVPLGGDDVKDRLVLPRAELRRVPDPRHRRPPIDGMPTRDVRPCCAWCDRFLRPVVGSERNKRRWFIRWNAYEDVFCTASCAIRFAGASYRGGFRRRGPS